MVAIIYKCTMQECQYFYLLHFFQKICNCEYSLVRQTFIILSNILAIEGTCLGNGLGFNVQERSLFTPTISKYKSQIQITVLQYNTKAATQIRLLANLIQCKGVVAIVAVFFLYQQMKKGKYCLGGRTVTKCFSHQNATKSYLQLPIYNKITNSVIY